MMATEIPVMLGQAVQAQPGDTFKFVSTTTDVSYRFAVSPPSGKCVIGLWKNSATKGNGVARNKQHVDYVDHKTDTGTFIVTVDGELLPYKMTVSKTPGFFNWITGFFG